MEDGNDEEEIPEGLTRRNLGGECGTKPLSLIMQIAVQVVNVVGEVGVRVMKGHLNISMGAQRRP